MLSEFDIKCQNCGKTLSVVDEKCPHCQATVTSELPAEHKKAFDQRGDDFVERTLRKAQDSKDA